MDGKKICPICGKPNGKNKVCCSMKCYAEYKQHYAVCDICGKKFKKSPSDTTTHTCGSKECKDEYRKKISTKEMAERMYKKIKICPNTGHFDTHHAALEWRLISPKGELYIFKNLVLWAEQNADKLPISLKTGKRVQPKTFVREITRLKSDHDKNKCLRNDYLGWRIAKKIIE